MTKNKISRRHLIKAGLALSLTAQAGPGQSEENKLKLTPACGSPPELTLSQTAGPFFSPNTPLKKDFRGDGSGAEEIVLTGVVVNQNCRPLARAHLELWHAGPQGQYDNEGFQFRGHQMTDDQGRYDFVTLMPGLYPGRTRHFHMIVQTPMGIQLVTQLYFPNETGNGSDWIFNEDLIMAVSSVGDKSQARFDFVLKS